MIRLIQNDERRNHSQLLRGWLTGCNDGFIAVAFLKSAGLRQIEADLIAFLERGGSLRVMVGTDFYLTEPEALRALTRIAQRHSRFQWKLVEQSSFSTFHPKYYRFRGDQYIWVLTGSANLTAGGLVRNIEVSTVAEEESSGPLEQETKYIEEALWTGERAVEPDEERIGSYAVRFDLTTRCLRKAAEEATKAVEGLPEFTGAPLKAELRVYLSDKNQKTDLLLRKANYDHARRLIRENLLDSSDVSNGSFESIYEKLVGRSGERRLWHSGSVHRGKAEVMKQKSAVLAMLQETAMDLNRSPEMMYEVGLGCIKEIKGLGPNIFTEFCHTFRPDIYAILNENPVTSLFELGIDEFPAPSAFKASDYGRFCRRIAQLAVRCGFADLGEVDHFLNFVYWRYKRRKTENVAN